MQKYSSYLLQCFSNILPGLQIRPKSQIKTFFDTNRGRDSIEDNLLSSLVISGSSSFYTHRRNLNIFFCK